MPIRAYCTICSDFFDNVRDVAAIHCGHTFHQDCLQRWFHSAPSRTCPQCRIQVSNRQIINKLFFDVGEEDVALDAESLKLLQTMACPEIDVERLIAAVAEHPELWDTACDLYKDKIKKSSAWVAVSRVVYPEFDTWSDREQKLQTHETINKWRTVRDNHTRVLKKKAAAARSGAKKKVHSYLYTEQLSFLRRTQEPRPTVSSIDHPSTSGSQEQHLLSGGSGSCQEEVDHGGADSQVEGDVETGQVPATAPTVSTGPVHKRRRGPPSDFEQAMVRFMGAHHPPPPRCTITDSEDMSFSHSCQSLLNQMTPAQKVEYRRRSLDLIHEILSRPEQAAVYHGAVPQDRQALTTHPPVSRVARPPPETGYHRSYVHGPQDPDAPLYRNL
uniref:TRAF interacting protein n=1 Tax=Leptobrachium leishanense TaxID=445787 RepID=A0A8C5PFU2_9ANUR